MIKLIGLLAVEQAAERPRRDLPFQLLNLMLQLFDLLLHSTLPDTLQDIGILTENNAGTLVLYVKHPKPANRLDFGARPALSAVFFATQVCAPTPEHYGGSKNQEKDRARHLSIQ